MVGTEGKHKTRMEGTRQILSGIRSNVAYFVCASCRHEPFGMDCHSGFGYMGVRDARFMGMAKGMEEV